MSSIDLILLFLLSLFAVRGYFKGLFQEIFSLLGFSVGFMVAVRFDEPMAVLWQSYWGVSFIILKTVGFIALFFAVYFAFELAGRFFHRAAKIHFLTGPNRVGGILLGTGKGAAFLALILFLLGSSPLLPTRMRERADNSYLVPPLYRFGQGLMDVGRDTLFLREGAEESNGAGPGPFRRSG